MSTRKPTQRTRRPRARLTLSRRQFAAIWIAAQKFGGSGGFGTGAGAVARAIEHLGYVQIDTINVIERCHHHILYNRLPDYRRADLSAAQAEEKSVFEYWTHALSYLPVSAFRFHVGAMKAHRDDPVGWGGQAARKDVLKMRRRIRDEGALSIADIKDDKLVEKSHLWASRKPSKRVLQAGFYTGEFVISKRDGMLKSYELTDRHFGWERLPKPVTERQRHDYLLDRALKAQGIVSLDSICHLNAPDKAGVAARIATRVRKKELVPLALEGAEKVEHWVRPEVLAETPEIDDSEAHILSPFDPLIIQRKRCEMALDYAHLFEAYVPADKRQWGYFTLPVLIGDEIVAGLDLKADRQETDLKIQAWHWFAAETPARRQAIEVALDRFSAFQFGD